MKKTNPNSDHTLEIMLVLCTLGLASVLYHAGGMKLVVLNLFTLPVVLAGFFLGRYRAGVLALLSVIAATIVVVSDLGALSGHASPLTVAISVTLWGAALGLTAMLVGTLCDDRDARAVEAHEAYVGVVEVLSRYLQSADPYLRNRAMRVAELSERVAERMRLSPREIDDIRVAALLLDMENIEITAKVIRKAVDQLNETNDNEIEQTTFHGTELVHSLGSTLKGAFPLLLSQDSTSPAEMSAELPFGARIIRTVRAYLGLIDSPWKEETFTEREALVELRSDIEADHHPAVLHALEEVVTGDARTPPAESQDHAREVAAAAAV